MTLPTHGPALERALEQGRANAKRKSWAEVERRHDEAIKAGEIAHPDDGGGLEDDAHLWSDGSAGERKA